jgi:hypothetical protein
MAVISDEVRRVGTVPLPCPGVTLGRATDAISHRPLAGAEQANFREVYGRILRRVAAEFGEDIALDAASAWG